MRPSDYNKLKAMDIRGGHLSLNEIHKSIESTLNSIKQQHKEIEDSACDVTALKKLATQVCRPISDTVRQHSASSLDSLRLMLSLHESVVRATITGSPISESISRLNSDVKDDVITRNPAHSGVCTLPPVVRTAHANIPKQRSSFPLTLRYPPILNTSLSPSGSRGSARLTSPLRRKSPTGHDHVEVSERHDSLRRYVDEVDRHVRTLQVTFSTFTQRVLVPLQTFCKLQRGSGKLQQRDGERSKENTEEKIVRSKTGDLHQSEFAIVQTMNRIRELLWPPQDGVSAEMFSNLGLSKKVLDEVAECDRFPVLRLLPDVLCKFSEVLQKSSFWLKRDILYTQNAKSALNRAHRRYVKTERLWQEARQSHRQLLSEWEHMNAEVHTNSTRLETLGHDIDMLREDLDRSQDQRRTLEIKLRTTSDNLDHLRARHRALRKRIIMLGTKIEQRERNYEFMESRVRSQRADQDAMQEKLRISEEYAGSLQSKMEQFYNSRAAWNRRYLEKSDPEILRTRLQSVQLRIPLPAVREKTFILKSKLDNIREAFTYIEDGLEENDVHWSTLCYQLKWPDQIVHTLPDIKTRKTKSVAQHKDLSTDSDDSSSTSSASSTSAGKSAPSVVRAEWRAARKIVDSIKRRFPNDETQQRSFMLRLWLRCNGQKATIDMLASGLRAAKLPDLASYIERLVT